MNTIRTLLACILLMPLFAAAQDAREIMKKSIDLTRIGAMELKSTLKIYDARGQERTRETVTASRKFGPTTKIITKFISPADVKGTGILVHDHEEMEDDMWIYLPALRKTRRIVSSEKGKSYMGSEFSNADMSIPNLEDFTYKLIGADSYAGISCWQVEAIPVDDDIADNNGYSRRVSWVDKEKGFTLKSEFYDFDDVVFKEIIMDNYEEIEPGRFMVRRMEARNLDNGRRSLLTIDEIQQGTTLGESSFSPAALEQ